MNEELALRSVVEMVPNWYFSAGGPADYSLGVKGTKIKFFSHRPPTPSLAGLLQGVRTQLPDLLERVKDFPDSVAVELVQEYFAELWLNQADPKVQWRKLFDYHRVVSSRTYENSEVGFNFIIKEAEGTIDVTDGRIQKILDPLASSNLAYFVVDPGLRFIEYRDLQRTSIKDEAGYRFYPEFIHPFVAILQPRDWLAHKTQRGDLVIANQLGLVAAKRKGRWKLYDAPTLKNSFVDVIGHYRVGANLFELVFDLSFRRHGALLVYDPERRTIPYVTNPESLLLGEKSDTVRRMLRDSVGSIRMGAEGREERMKGLFLEVASLDGAVIFTADHILAIGAMIRSHEQAGGQAGARSTAALSAFRYGARPIKISSDGEITFYFESCDEKGNTFDAYLDFL